MIYVKKFVGTKALNNKIEMNINVQKKWQMHLGSLLVVIILLATAAVSRDGKLMGRKIGPRGEATADTAAQVKQAMTIEADGSVVVNTTDLGKDITGYGGVVPLRITLKDDKVVKVEALHNDETPEFFNQARQLLSRWEGKTIDEALEMEVDGVSGATYSSKAIIGNMQAGLSYAKNQIETSAPKMDFDFSAQSIAGLLVAIMAAVLPLFIRNKVYRICQQVLNVAVLGFWCGSFLSYSALLGYMSNGMNVLALIVPVILLITAFVYPLFGKKSYYCTHVCPFGSLQELAGRCSKRKMRISADTIKKLDTFREILWAVLMLLLLVGVWTDWVNYEPFTAFIFQHAHWLVIVIAVTFVLLSFVVMRPYCRFVCPMGTLLKVAQGGWVKRK